VVAVPGTVVGEGVDPHGPGDPSQTPALKRQEIPSTFLQLKRLGRIYGKKKKEGRIKTNQKT
jgi:hypothetical protein